MMTGKFLHLKYAEHSDFWAVELPYYRRPISMVFLMPNAAGEAALKALERQLPARWNEMVASPAPDQAVILTIPQFNLEGSFDLVDTLSNLGLGTLFRPAADFSGISDEPGFGIDAIKHKTYLSVDENGTEAAAVTWAMMLGASLAEPPEWITLSIDRPFLFAIVEKLSGVILFLGRIED